MSLRGRRIVVTRASDRAESLANRLRALGAEVVEVPTIRIVDPSDGGVALAGAVARLETYDWVIVTSANGAARFVAACAATAGAGAAPARLAAIGPATADTLAIYGLMPEVVPERFVAEGLLEVFPPGPGRVLVPQARVARPMLVDGLRAKGWTVEVVEAYQTVPAELPASLLAQAAAADAITFASSSAVANYVNAAGSDAVPAIVVCIGPATAATARERGLPVAAVADTHDLDGLVRAVVQVLS